MWSCMFVSITPYIYNQLTYSLHRITSIYQPNSTDVVITMPGALGRWSHSNDIYLMQQNEQLFETMQTLSQNMQSLMEKTDECEQYVSELARVSHEKWAKVVLKCSLT